ncbi:hypothetical protein EII22_04080 [Coriobacteriales bacterium OH1046]|nr:hypothetical protein EII22_04080 [Coriobacteriales bacterium OH1046]
MFARLKDCLPKHHPELLLDFDEYVETWGELIETGYGSIVADEKILPSLSLRGDAGARLFVEAALVLCYDAMRTWCKGRRVPDKARISLENAVVDEVGRRVLGEEATGEFSSLYRVRLALFSQLMPGSGKTDKDAVLHELVGAARYAASRCSSRDEERDVEGIQLLALHFVRAHALFLQLSANSIPDGNTILFKKPRFIVREGE